METTKNESDFLEAKRTALSSRSVWPIFISYRRSDLTQDLAVWLKRQLESQPIEATTGQVFYLDVFVDAAESHHTDFQANLVPRLEHSRALILLVDNGAATRRPRGMVDYLYDELDWWAEKRKKTPPIILQLDRVSGVKLVAEAKFAKWRKVNFMDSFWERWSPDAAKYKVEREDLLVRVRRSIRDYGQVIHLEEVVRLKRRALIAMVLGLFALLAAGLAYAAYAKASGLLREASRSDFANAQARLADGRWLEGVAYLGRSLRYDPNNARARDSLWLALLYGERKWQELPLLSVQNKGQNRTNFSPDGTRMIKVGDNIARVWDIQTGEPLNVTLQQNDGISSAQLSEDNARILTMSGDNKTVRVWDARRGRRVGALQPHAPPVGSATFSPDGAKVVSVCGDQNLQRVQIWTATGQPLGLPIEQKDMGSVSFSPDGTRVVIYGGAGAAQIWNTTTAESVGARLQHKESVLDASFSPDGARVVTASWDGTARVWNAATSQPIGSAMEHGGPIMSAKFSPDGTRIVTASYDSTAQLWDATTGNRLGVPMQHNGPLLSARFSPDATRVVTASNDGTARIWSATTGEAMGASLQHKDGVLDAYFGSDGTRIVTNTQEETMIWYSAVGRPLGVPLDHNGPVNNVSFSPNGRSIVTASDDKTARLWDSATGQPVGKTFHHEGSVHSASFSPDNRRLITTSENTLTVWNVLSGNDISGSLRHSGAITSASFNSTGLRIVTTTNDKKAYLWDATTYKSVRSAMEHKDNVTCARFSPDGARVVTTSWDGTARIWDSVTGQPIGSVIEHPNRVTSAEFSPDGTRLVTTCGDGAARFWDAATGKSVGIVLKHINSVKSANFSPDGTRIITTTGDYTAQVWDARTGLPVGKVLMHPHWVDSARFSPVGNRVVTTCRDMTARIWDASTGQPIGVLLKHHAVVSDVAFSPDGKRVVTACRDKTARIWDICTQETLTGVTVEQLAAFCSGALLDRSLGALQVLSDADRLVLWNRLHPALADSSSWRFIARDFSGDLLHSRTSVYCQLPIRQSSTRLIRTGVNGCILEALAFDPGNPLAQIALSQKQSVPTGTDSAERGVADAEFLREFSVQHLPDDTDLCSLAAKMLLDLGDTSRAKRAMDKVSNLKSADPHR